MSLTSPIARFKPPLRFFLKAVADCSAMLAVLPAFIFYRVVRLILGPEKTFPGWSQLFSLIPGLPGPISADPSTVSSFAAAAPGAWIGFGTVFSHPGCSIGRNAYIGVYCCLGEVTLEDDVLIGSHVSIMNGSRQHGTDRLDIPVREQPGVWPHVTIGRDTWIGDRAVIMADVGRHCLVGAGSVVTTPLPNYAVAVGNPARIVRYRTAEQPSEIAGRIAAEFAP